MPNGGEVRYRFIIEDETGGVQRKMGGGSPPPMKQDYYTATQKNIEETQKLSKDTHGFIKKHLPSLAILSATLITFSMFMSKNSKIISTTLTTIWQIIGAAVDIFLAPLAPIIAKFLPLMAEKLFRLSEILSEKLEKIVPGLLDWIELLFEDPTKAMEVAWEFFIDQAGKAWEWIKDKGLEVWDNIEVWALDIWRNKIPGWASAAWEKIEDFAIGTVWPEISKAAKNIFENIIPEPIMKIFETIASFIGGKWEEAGKIASSSYSKEQIAAMEKYWRLYEQEGDDYYKELGWAAQNFFDTWESKGVTTFEEFQRYNEDRGSQAWNFIELIAGDMWNRIEIFATGVWNVIKEAIINFIVKDLPTILMDALVSGAKSIIPGIAKAAAEGATGVEDITSGKSWWEKIQDVVGGPFYSKDKGWGWPSMQDWKKEFFGGILNLQHGSPYVPRDMLAMIHKGERMIPAWENRPDYTSRNYGFNINNTINIQGAALGLDTEKMARELTKRVTTELARGLSMVGI